MAPAAGERRIFRPRDGIAQQNPSFPASPFGAGNQALRGSFESKGQIDIADQWKFGWEFTLLSDKWFLNDYHVPSQTRSSNYFSETTSTVYLTGQGERGYFDLRGYYFEGLSSHDFQPQQPLAHPVWDYNKTFDIDPAQTFGVGGQVELDFNLTSLSAASASFQSVGPQVLDNVYGLYNVCRIYVPGRRGHMPSARRRRRIHARHARRVVEAQDHRSDRRSVDAVRLRALQRRMVQPQHDQHLYLRVAADSSTYSIPRS